MNLSRLSGCRSFVSHTSNSSRPSTLGTLREHEAHQGRQLAGSLLRMVMFGKPGAGKGTLSSKLVKKYGIETVSTGDLLRQNIVQRTPVGIEAEKIMARGGLIPDEVMLKVLSGELDTMQHKSWILDGFPRTLRQGTLLDTYLSHLGTPLTLVVNLDVPDQVILSRITDRWVHQPSGRVYNLSYNPPKVSGHDDETGEPLTKRPDDNPEIFSRRLTQFYEATSPLLQYYSSTKSAHPDLHPHQLSFSEPGHFSLVSLSGNTSDEIWPQLDAAVLKAFPAIKERPLSMKEKQRQSLTEAVLASPLDALKSSL